MIKRSALTMAIGLTAFIMTVAAGVLYQLSVSDTATVNVAVPAQSSNATVALPARSIDLAAPAVAVTSDQAATIAIKAVPNSQLLRAPELVNYQDAVAYEVALAAGVVYVDANTAQVLYNGALPARGVAQRRGEREHGSEHGSFFGSDGEHDED